MLVLCYHDSCVIVSLVMQRVLQLGVSGMPFCHIMRMLIMSYHGEVSHVTGVSGTACHCIDCMLVSGVALAD